MRGQKIAASAAVQLPLDSGQNNGRWEQLPERARADVLSMLARLIARGVFDGEEKRAAMNESKVRSTHLQREAWVYVRQSTMTQVREHPESLARQYELAERAGVLGWAAEAVRVVDEDLGRSGAEATARVGFQSLVAAVGLGQVGIVLGIEVSRLARNNADWYHLLDLCALTDTLIADADGLYHAGDYNDRLVLGLKGTMSEAELHLLRSRLNAGLRHKAARGELRQGLPVGFDYDEGGRVVMTADEAVTEAIRTVFRRFEELGTARQVLLSLRDDGVLLPRRTPGTRRIRWAEATYPAVHDFLSNPAYAGAFVFGRTKIERRLNTAGQVVAHCREVPMAEWEVCLPDHHPGFVSWEAYLANRERLRANWRAPAGDGGGAPREGRALLQGLVRCGRCGRRMQVSYSGGRSRYLCGRAQQLYGIGKRCQSLAGRRLEVAVLDEVFAVLEPASLAATAQALTEAETVHQRRLRVFETAAERARFEADRARRQFDACEPENRLVARSLERVWEERLVAQRQAETDLGVQRAKRPATLTPDEVTWLSRAGADLRAVFDAATTTIRDRKHLLRALISEVVITVDSARSVAAGHIAWEGGATTTLELAVPRRGDGAITTDKDTVDLVRRLAVHYDDATIARHLARQGRATATGLPFTKERVASLRRERTIPGRPAPAETPGTPPDFVSVTEAQRILGVSRATIHRWLADGFIAGDQDTTGGPWRIHIDTATRAKVVPNLPDGWVGLADAAAALGLARQTILDRIHRGEIEAVHVTRGRRPGLAIRLPAPTPDLFNSLQS